METIAFHPRSLLSGRGLTAASKSNSGRGGACYRNDRNGR